MELLLTEGNGEFGVSMVFPEAVNPPTDRYWTFASRKEVQDFARELAFSWSDFEEEPKAEP